MSMISSSSIVVVIVVGLLKLSMGMLDGAAIYVGQVNFNDVLSNRGTQINQEQLDEVFAGFVGGSDSQLSEEPIDFSNTAQATLNNFVGLSTPNTQASFPEFNDLIGRLSSFGSKKGSIEIDIDEEQIPLKDSLFDILSSD